MNNFNNEGYSIIESLISIFTIDKGKVKVLLFRKKDEPYKGYWMLPGGILKANESLEESISDYVVENCGFSNLYTEQCHVFSDVERIPDKRVVAITCIGLIDSISVELKQEIPDSIESEWFNISAIPKTIYDHGMIIDKSVDCLRERIINSNVLKILFPSDFTLPELQKVYEQILGKELDRRNFRKKFINLGLIEDTGYKNEGYTGRPAKLYRFKENIEERDLF
ncbi:MAG TPA: NUDIX hydrolase [Mollicutes bacterium]|jgi:8-oxo-dGTP diphosphatase|nr:NUDIX hydrolase [Mollicutes bacterium]